MKEILKYLRNINSYTQSDISQKIGVSRQTYFKYESGAALPSEKILQKMAEIYKVDEAFIKANKIPALTEKKEDLYDMKSTDFEVASPSVKYGSSAWSGQRSYDAYFDGNTVRVMDGAESNFSIGQRFKLVEVDEDEEMEKKRKAINTLMKFRGTLDLPADFDYKKELMEALDEK
jgi:transcriptional regulator with XRE-family HTH domain